MHLSTVVVPRNCRLRLTDMRACKWLVPDWRCLACPLAVSRNRFLVPLCVFCFGMVVANPKVVWKDQLGKTR
jgi:hypothetical protein